MTDGAAMHALASACPPLEANTCYAYLLLCTHFAESCLMAEDESGPLGYIAGYRVPDRRDTLFVWQIGVHERGRGQGLGARMLHALLGIPANRGMKHLETTVAPDNAPSQRLFRSFAEALGASCGEQDFFEPSHFGGASHEAERLFRIGPIPEQRPALQPKRETTHV
jgi:L-2,4-diaminobutyric acid acetyltransferase